MIKTRRRKQRPDIACAGCGKIFQPLRPSQKRTYCSISCGARKQAADRRVSGPSADDLFWSRVDKNEAGECWRWTGPCGTDGYGRASHRSKLYLAHRLAFELTNGPIGSPKVYVCHSCDNRWCVNPAHLWLGSHADNMRDAKEKGRIAGQGKTHCSRGHEYTPENTVFNSRGTRNCRACIRVKQRNIERRRLGWSEERISATPAREYTRERL